MILIKPKHIKRLHEEVLENGIELSYLHDYNYFNDLDMMRLEEKLNDTVDGDTVNIIPACQCKAIIAEYERGNVCPECGTVVKDRMTDFEPDLWIRIPEEFKYWISPGFVKRFTNALPVSARHLFRWLGDKRNNPTIKGISIAETPIFQAIRNMENFERSYLFFIDNIPEIIKTVISVSKDTESNKRLRLILEYYEEFKDRLFYEYLPVLSRRFMIKERGIRTNHIFKDSVYMSDAVLTLQSAFSTGKDLERRVTNHIVAMSEIFDNLIKNVVGGKHGLFKENIEGMRVPFTMRAVITSIVGKHEYDEIRLPWGPSVFTFKPFLINKLRRRGYKYNDIINKIMRAINNYDREIDEIFDELIEERGGYINITANRNPAMSNFGTLCLKLYKVKTDPEDTTISLSTKVVGYPNGDIDGDQMNITISIDRFISDAYEKLKPENCVAGRVPGELFEKVTITKPVVAIISNRIQEEKKRLGL